LRGGNEEAGVEGEVSMKDSTPAQIGPLPDTFTPLPTPADVYASPPVLFTPVITHSPPDYHSRIQAFVHFAESTYGIHPTDAACLLLPFLPPASDYPPIWLIVHTGRNLLWDHLSTAIARLGLPAIDTLSIWRIRDINDQFAYARYLALTRRFPRILLDSSLQDSSIGARGGHFRPVPGQPTLRANYRKYWFREIEKECLRLVIRQSPKPMPPPRPGSAERLAHLFLRAVDWGHRSTRPVPIIPSQYFMATMDLLLRLNPEFCHWPILSTGLCLAGPIHAALNGRSTLTPSDRPILTRLLQSCLYGWRWEVLRELAGPATTRSRLATASGAPLDSIDELLTAWGESGVIQWQSTRMAADVRMQAEKRAGIRTNYPVNPQSKRQRAIHGSLGRAVTLTKEYGPDVRRLVGGEGEWW